MSTRNQTGTNLKQLWAFDAVARNRSFSRAAVELGRSQATLSLQIRELELRLDVQLLERTTRQVSLTAAGQALASALERGFQSISNGVDLMRGFRDDRQSRVVVACVPSLSGVRLPAILALYRARDRATRIDVAELTSLEIVEAVSQGQVDFGVGPCLEPPPPEIGFTACGEEPLRVLLPVRLAAGWRDAVPFKELMALPLITLSGSVLLQRHLEEVAKTVGVRLSSQTEVRHVQTAVGMARAGIGAAIVPALSISDHLDEGVIAMSITAPPLIRTIGIIAQRGKALRPGAASLARHISGQLAKALAPYGAEVPANVGT